ncbi:FAD-dependent oxidoreductase [Sphingomonas yunnanensis]|uniref:flavin monoamine oxidase family protein n=1 Tax=Sphingomonas yunnanensis TaxID=310400 RepID=UPI001CA77B1F|nr:NAD(P)/FAD-dependent oxidoreductase [Sphingomonas yunnanensis]MBY9061818.1 FAD-dependent oxidoreductase [Sphingomonas yunnanensis]
MSGGADAVVVGGGAAGIAAARHLHDAGRDVLLLEAGDRLGGRARSIAIGAATVDLGCGWLHSAQRNPWTDIAGARGFTVATDTARWGEQWRDLGFPRDDHRDANAARERMTEAAHALAAAPDRPLGAAVPRDERWRPLLDAISRFSNGAAIDHVSLHDWLAYEDAATEDNWAVREGYGTLIADHARGLSVRLGCAVTRVDHRGARVRVESAAGTIETDAVVVAVPTPVLARGAIAFDPPLPEKIDAATRLPLGVADKVMLRVDRPEWPADSHLLGNPFSADTASHRLSPFGYPLIESFLGGPTADGLENTDSAAAFVVDELVALLGSEWRARLYPVTATCWRHEPWIGGSYSHAAVGHAGARAVLAAPIDVRLYFAGEACSPHDFSTAHGAYETGIAAARAVLGEG